MILWIVGLVGAMIGLITDYMLYKSLRKITGTLKTSFIFFLAAAMTYLSSVLCIIILAIRGLPIANAIWNIVPILFILASIFWFVSMFKLASFFKYEKGGAI